MDSRLSISNHFRPISFEQFKAMVTEFKNLVERSYGTPCQLNIRAMNRMKMTSTFMHDDHVMDFMADSNKKATFWEGSELESMESQTYAQAVYIEVGVHPIEKSAAPNYAFGHVEFKGSRPRQATYYIQPGDRTVIDSLRAANRFKSIGDGYTHNTDWR